MLLHFADAKNTEIIRSSVAKVHVQHKIMEHLVTCREMAVYGIKK